MKIKSLKKTLVEIEIPIDAYYLKGGLPNEAFCIGFNHGLWEVYYSERGNKSGIKKFSNEEDACEYFLAWMEDIFIR